MRRIFTLLWLTLAAFTFKADAQTTTCNADFTWQYINAYTVKFTPAVNDSPVVHHEWNFGDGSPVTPAVSPVHMYTLPGTYTVKHTVVRFGPNGTAICTQVVTHTVVIQSGPTTCNLIADFNWTATAANPLTIQFHNQSTPSDPSDSVRWTFGDGTTVNGIQGNPAVANPVHTYTAPGTYNVCLRVKKNVNTSPNACIKEICKTIVIPQPCNLVADFTWNATTSNPLVIQYHNTSTPSAPSDSVRWMFGDGSVLNGLQSNPAIANPLHIYNVPGTYTVCLIVKKNNTPNNSPCIRYICKTIVVPLTCNLIADFSWTVTQNNPLRIEFHNQSNPVAVTDSVRWTFGDGSSVNGIMGDPAVANPVHTYNVPGTYTVCLRIKRNANSGGSTCVKEICKTIVVYAPQCNLVADFSAQPDPAHPLRIKFTNLSVPSSPTDSVRWTFGDGTSVSGLQSDPNVANPTHDYAQAGNYSVCLRVKKNVATSPAPCVREICKNVIVEQPCNFQVNFSWQLDQSNPRKVYFTNLTIVPTANAVATWYFGDGTSASSWNAVHEYAQPGRYYVCLKIQLSNTCIKYKCDSILIPTPLPPCNNQSNFNILSTTGNSQTFTFVPVFQSAAAQYTWTFGDGTGSHDMIATHHYTQPGTYTACLTVWRSSTCASTTCKTVQVTPQINCDSVHVTYSYQPDPQVPNKIHFYANSNYPILDQTWTIQKLPISSGGQTVTLHQNNPTYLFQDTGYYRVCLRAITLGGCIKEYCSVIHITQVSNACLLQTYPNPASNLVNVNVTLTAPEMIHAYMYNSQNVLVKEKHVQGTTGNNVVTFEINNLPAGMYTIKLIYGNHICYAMFQKL